MDCFIGLDIGTSSVKGMLLSEKAIVKTASREYPLYYPKDGWSEQNPQDWYDGSISVIKELVSDIDRNSVVSISFSGQMHGLVVLDENDNVIRPAILWNDSRSSRETEYLNNVIGKETLQQNTGNIAFSGFTAPKVLWLKTMSLRIFKRRKKSCSPRTMWHTGSAVCLRPIAPMRRAHCISTRKIAVGPSLCCRCSA